LELFARLYRDTRST